MSLVGSNNQEKIWNFFKSKGLNDYGAASIMGNLYAESGLMPNNLQNTGNNKLGMTDDEYVLSVDNGTYSKDKFVYDSHGFGLAQWAYWSRKKSLYEFAKSENKSIGDLEMQLNFLIKELNESFKPLLNTLKSATSVLQASNAVLFEYENPADQSTSVQNQRASYGQVYYDKYVTKASNKINIGGNRIMKYNNSNKPMVCMQTNSTCYKGTKTMDVKGVLWHSTGANNPSLKRYVQPSDNASDRKEWLKLLGENKNRNDWNHAYVQAGLNAWIGKLADGTVTSIQTMPWNFAPWGCASGWKGSCNNGWIQFEICEDSLTDKNYFNKVYEEACELTAYLCKLYNIDPKGYCKVNGVNVPTILCHKDSYSLGFGSNHGDVYHWFKRYGKDMDDVRNDVYELMNNAGNVGDTQATTPTAPAVTIPNSSKVENNANSTNSSSNIVSNNVKFKIGDIVNFVGDKHYTSSSAINGSAVKSSKAKITSIFEKGKHPYHIRAVNDKGVFISGVYGWVDASAISAIGSSPTSSTPVVSAGNSTSTQSNKEVDIVAGTKLNLKNVPLYVASGVSYKSSTKTGIYYVWDKSVIKNRIRITNKPENAGKANKVTGWIDYEDAKKSAVN